MTQHEIMTIKEVAEYLRVSERTIYDWATKNQIPCGKLGTTWRFKRAEVEQWVDERLSQEKAVNRSGFISIRDILHPGQVLILNTPSKKAAITALVESLSQTSTNQTLTSHTSAGQTSHGQTSPGQVSIGHTSVVKNQEELLEGIFHREELMSTGIGLGIGVPHVRLASVKDLRMSVGVSDCDITDYESLDGQPIRIIFLIVAGKDQHAQHIKALAAISRKVKDNALREALLAAKDPQKIYDILTRQGN